MENGNEMKDFQINRNFDQALKVAAKGDLKKIKQLLKEHNQYT